MSELPTKKAGQVLDWWIEFCVACTGMGNCWTDGGDDYLYELDQKPTMDENVLKGFSGVIFKRNKKTHQYNRHGKFEISKGGVVMAAPKILARIAERKHEQQLRNKRERDEILARQGRQNGSPK